MRFLIILFCIFLPSCYTITKVDRKKNSEPTQKPTIHVEFEDIDEDGDQNISANEFIKYKESTKKGLVDPNVDYKRPITISLIILGSIMFFCFLPKMCQIARKLYYKGCEKSKEYWDKRRSKK